MKNSCLALIAILCGFSVLAKDDTEKASQIIVTPKVATPGIKAVVKGEEIDLSDGRTLTIKKSPSKYVTPQVVFVNPSGAKVKIEYEDGQNTFNGKVPFVYNVPAVKNNEYFKVTVDEGGPEKTWHINLQHESNVVLTIE